MPDVFTVFLNKDDDDDDDDDDDFAPVWGGGGGGGFTWVNFCWVFAAGPHRTPTPCKYIFGQL